MSRVAAETLRAVGDAVAASNRAMHAVFDDAGATDHERDAAYRAWRDLRALHERMRK